MKKVLFVATIHKHFLTFHLPYIQLLKEMGVEVHCVANGSDKVPFVDRQFTLPLQRSPYRWKNIRAIRELKRLIETERYDLVHCHTAMGAFAARLASINGRREGWLRVLYTAHGFHFCQGSPWYYWVIYYPIEWFLSRFTDAIITINEEDYQIICSSSFRQKKSYKIAGIGVDSSRLMRVDSGRKAELRQQQGIDPADFVLIYIAEYSKNKNHQWLIDLMPELLVRIPSLRLLFAGRGQYMEAMKEHARQKQVDSSIEFLGFRTDIGELIALSDVGISVSRREGLGLNLAEIMFSGLPVVASINRGHRELVLPNQTGYLVSLTNPAHFIDAIIRLYEDPSKRVAMGEAGYRFVQQYSLENSLRSTRAIYEEMLR